jgi:glycosyltransferase involved in cell wall biosynthesis
MNSTEPESVRSEVAGGQADKASRVSVGLPVYNGEKYLSAALDSLLAQTFEDFELVISDNGSTDGTEAICREYAHRDPRVCYQRSPVNRGLAWNHNRVVRLARGEYFKWAGHDDVYHPDMLRRCVEVLDREPDVVLCSAQDIEIDDVGSVIREPVYELVDTASPRPYKRFRAILLGRGGHDIYGVIRTEVLRRTMLTSSAYSNDRAMMAELALRGRFHHLPDVLLYIRDHTQRTAQIRTLRSKIAVLDPHRGNALLHPMFRIYAEYTFGFFRAIARVPLPWDERARCYVLALAWLSRRLLERATPRRASRAHQGGTSGDPAPLDRH